MESRLQGFQGVLIFVSEKKGRDYISHAPVFGAVSGVTVEWSFMSPASKLPSYTAFAEPEAVFRWSAPIRTGKYGGHTVY